MYDLLRLAKMLAQSKTDPEIRQNDILYISEDFRMDMFSLVDHLSEYYLPKKIGFYFSHEQKEAKVLVLDWHQADSLFLEYQHALNDPQFKINDDTLSTLRELLHAYEYNQRLIDIRSITINIHKGLTVIDDQMLKNLSDMIQSEDGESVKMGIGVMLASDRSDIGTIKALKELTKLFEKSRINKHYPEVIELTNFINRIEYYDIK